MSENLHLLVGSFDKYISHLAQKRQKTLDSASSSGANITDSIHVKVLNKVSSVPSQLNGLVDELSTKLNYEYLFVQDFTPTKRLDRFYYIRLLEKGIPFPAILCTYSVGGSVGNYHFIWKIPEHSSPSVLATENQSVIEKIKEEIPKFHKKSFRQQFIDHCGILVPGAKSYALREIFKWITGKNFLTCI